MFSLSYSFGGHIPHNEGLINMKIEKIHSFLVNPDKKIEEKSLIRGTEVVEETGIKNVGSLYKMLSGIYNDAPFECKYEIAFQHNEDGSQQNDCKDLLVEYTKTGDYAIGLKIAEHLQNQTTKRSGLGLLFLILGKNDNKKRLVISRFPADNGILAEESTTSLNVKFVERIFMKNAKAYKSAIYEGALPEMDFWKGRAIDKQINSDLTIADYWIKDFLKSDFATTGERGTKRLATALRDAINNSSTSIAIKEELTAAIKLAKGLNGHIVSPSSFLTRLRISNESIEVVKSSMKSSLFDEQFKFTFEEMDKLIAFKTIELDNGAYLSAQASAFENIFSKELKENDNVEFSTQGIIITERVRKTK
jgi:hypothetical protein